MPKSHIILLSFSCLLVVLLGCNDTAYECGMSGCVESSEGIFSSKSDCEAFCGDTGGGSGGTICLNTCPSSFDGECDDGGPDALYSICDYGTDCADCGTRAASGSGGGGESPGEVSFWISRDFGCGNIVVSISGEGSRTITGFYSLGLTSCGASGCANFNLSPGSYTYTASCSGYTWGPTTVKVNSGSCTLQQLTR